MPEIRDKASSANLLGQFSRHISALASGEPVLEQLRARHADMMRMRPEVGPGAFKDRENFARQHGSCVAKARARDPG